MSLCRFPQIAAREITPRDIYPSRRGLLSAAAATAMVIADGVPASAAALSGKPIPGRRHAEDAGVKPVHPLVSGQTKGRCFMKN